MMNIFRMILLSILIYGCSFDKHEKKNNSIVDTLKSNNIDLIDSLISIDSSKIDTIEKLNLKDENGLKQGKWVKKFKGKVIETKHYKNDTLNGYYVSFNNGGGYEVNYINGKREGIFKSWYVYKKSLLAVGFFENDTQIWMGFPAADENNLFPVKGFHIERDSVYIKAPYENDKTWYEGNFCLRPSKMRRVRTFAYGIHKIYFRNGKIKGIIDYSKEIIQEFDSTGKELYKAKFNDYSIHKQTI